ncbi:MAG: ATP-binding protein [Chitinophagales bacterium]
MQAINSRKLLETTERLARENAALQQQLREARKSLDAIRAGNIDAVVIRNKKNHRVFTEKTADKTYRILIEKMNEGAVSLNKDGTILYCNSYFARLVRLPLQKVLGIKFKKFIAPSSKKRFDALLQQKPANALKEEVYIQTNEGTSIPVLVSVNSLTQDNNYLLNIILTDLTIHHKNQEELKRSSEQLQQKNIELESANTELTAFTYLSSHDLQEPLRKIQTFVSLVFEEEYKNLSDNGKDYFRRMQQTAKQMRALIEDLLIYSRTKAIDRNFKKTDLSIIVNQVKKDFQEVIGEKKATIESGHLCKIKIIPFQFRQLLHNLIGNSLKFFNPANALRIVIKSKISGGSAFNNKKLSPEIDYCHIVYTDNGIGFDLQYKDRIFEVFQRLHNKQDYPGTGMGLAICKRVVENHDGIITATGKLNKGARFDIYIPVK